MSKLQTTLEKLPNIAKYITVLLVILFISWLSPNSVRFKYLFEKGQTWRYEDLYAPFDFAIKKTKQEIKLETAHLRGEFSPYYQIDARISNSKKDQFLLAFDKELNLAKAEQQYNDVINRPNKYKKYASQFIDRIYNRGIIDLEEEHETKGQDFVINVVNGNTVEQKTIQRINTVEDVYQWLDDSLLYRSKLQEPEFIFRLLEETFIPNLSYNDTLTNRFRQKELNAISQTRGMLKKGDLIIAKDGIVTDDIYQSLISYQEYYEGEVIEQQSQTYILLGYFLLTSLIVGIFLLYLQYHAKHVYDHFARVAFMLLWLVVYSYFVYVVEGNNALNAYLIPFCIVPIVIKNFFDERLALFTHIVVVLIASYLSSLGYEFTFMQILAGIVAILAYTDSRDWSRFFFTILYIAFAYCFAYLGLSLIKEGSFSTLDFSVYPWLIINVFLTLLAYPLIPLLERLFGFTSSITLAELSDLNRPLLKELSLKAQGTLQHSLQVANLSEAAASAIGADALLVKVAALYHDIGKMAKPEFYIENQSGENPHVKLTNFESAKIIIDHVEEGVKLAKKHRLPPVLIDFIETHHGDTRVEYFYRNELHQHPNKEFDESLFRYPGPRPRSKEETILMVADSLEAASKSLKNPTGEDIDKLVNKIIAGKITNGQLTNSKISFDELEKCIKVFKQLLRSINHVRIEYPPESKK